MKTEEPEEEDDFELDEEELAAALANPDPKKAVHGDAGNLELWDEDFARELEKGQRPARRSS